MAEKDKARDARDSGVGVEEPTKKEQRAALKEVNEAVLDTRPIGRQPDGLGNEVMAFAPETEHERSIRVNGDPVLMGQVARERERASEKARASALKAAEKADEEARKAEKEGSA